MHPFGGLRLSHGHKISDALKIYSEHGEAGLQPKKRGRQLGAKQKPVQELTPMEKLELRIKQLEAENAILKKVAALKDWQN